MVALLLCLFALAACTPEQTASYDRVNAIRAANGLRSSRLRAGRSYTIPIRRTPPNGGPVVVPPRRLPPELQARTVAAAPTGTGGAEAPAAEER